MNKLNVILLLLALGSGFAVVTVQNQSRQHYIVLDKAQKQEVQLDQDYARLQLAQAKLSNHKLIESAAARANLRAPSAEDTRMIELK